MVWKNIRRSTGQSTGQGNTMSDDMYHADGRSNFGARCKTHHTVAALLDIKKTSMIWIRRAIRCMFIPKSTAHSEGFVLSCTPARKRSVFDRVPTAFVADTREEKIYLLDLGWAEIEQSLALHMSHVSLTAAEDGVVVHEIALPLTISGPPPCPSLIGPVSSCYIFR